MRIVRAVGPFLCYAVATFVAMEVSAATGGVAQAWLLFSLPLLVFAYAEAGRVVGFEISAGRLLLCALIGGMGHWVAPFFGSESEFTFVGIWVFVEVGVVAAMFLSNVTYLVVWSVVAIVALAGEFLLFRFYFGPDVFFPDFQLSVLQLESMRSRFRLFSFALLSVDFMRNVGLFALAYRWRIKSEVAEA